VPTSETVYDRLGLVPGINARGTYTDLGGSSLTPKVWAAMAEANRYFAEFPQLLDAAGETIARLMETDAARVTPGASAAIALGVAACMTGTDGAKMEQLPDTMGMKDEVLIQRAHRYKYDRMVRMTGARLVEVGSDTATSPDELAASIGSNTAAVFFPAHLDGVDDTTSLEKTIRIAQEYGVPTLVDAAYLNYPSELMRSFTKLGADLVIFSAKYFGGPNAGGFVCGDRALIDAVAGVDFTGFESGQHLIFGRPFKLDRWSVVAVVLALENWLTMDHASRWEKYRRAIEAITQRLPDRNWLRASPMHFTMEEDVVEGRPPNCLVIQIDPNGETTAERVYAGLRSGRPAVFVHLRGDTLIVDVEEVREEDVEILAERLSEELQGRGAGASKRGGGR
jgi:D-glucosaminate-6-phosphate ammonia-lyase